MPATLKAKPRAPQTGGGRRGPIDFRDFGGGGGGGRGDNTPDYGERLRRYRLGLALALVAIVLLFVTFSGAFLVRQGLGSWDISSGGYIRDWQPFPLPWRLLLFNTVMLLLSSIAIELARRQAKERAVLAPALAIPGISAGPQRPVPWLWVSAALGLTFLAGQALAWQRMVRHGINLADVPSSSFFYVLTAAHAIHLAGGIFALLYAAATTALLDKSLETRRIVVDITAWYWHVMTVLWVYIFGVLALAR